ncbi:aspartate-semialdehyde dehydrogenase [Helicobacter bizzozeronii]|uniref:aspartate-semialdehyde dehydrogenase n=1 Tax=Helicobacter bizzozeronii TaxID=56877 RepID=UPI000CEF2E43|nr:aspartate-semialdehyde dehydrogenase [Helicobacter bizzozeronii]
MKTYNIALVGASGAVGEEIIKVLEERAFPVGAFFALASAKSAGKKIRAFGEDHTILETTQAFFSQEQIDIAFFSAGKGVSEVFAPYAVQNGAVVVDNTSFFRLQADVPLVVPEVNAKDLQNCPRSIIANPNCSTIQMVQVLNPLHHAFKIARVDVSTYQAVSGAGKKGIYQLQEQIKDSNAPNSAFPHPIAFNVIPQIDVFLPSGYTKEEMKMVQETHKIMHANFPISATCVRVPVLRSHSESLSISFEKPVSALEARELLKQAPNVVVLDEPTTSSYPTPLIASHKDQSFVGRIRDDLYNPHMLHLWCVADQLRVGAATNAVKIALALKGLAGFA